MLRRVGGGERKPGVALMVVALEGLSFKPAKDGFEDEVLSFPQEGAAYLICLMSQAATFN